MRWLNNFITVVGGTTLGAGLAGVSLSMIAFLLAPPRRSEFDDYGMLAGFLCGLVPGGILGFVLALRAVAQGWNEGAERSKPVWIGGALGLAVAVVILSPGWVKGVPYPWWVAIPIASALVLLGGIAAGIAEALWRRVRKARRNGPPRYTHSD